MITSSSDGSQLRVAIFAGVAKGCTFVAIPAGTSSATLSPGQSCPGNQGFTVSVSSGSTLTGSGTSLAFNFNGSTSTGCTFMENDIFGM